jgi:hypothetical protein
MDCFNLPVIAEKYNKDLSTLSNIEKIELAEYFLKNYFEGSEQTAKELPLEHFICNKTVEDLEKEIVHDSDLSWINKENLLGDKQ